MFRGVCASTSLSRYDLLKYFDLPFPIVTASQEHPCSRHWLHKATPRSPAHETVFCTELNPCLCVSFQTCPAKGCSLRDTSPAAVTALMPPQSSCAFHCLPCPGLLFPQGDLTAPLTWQEFGKAKSLGLFCPEPASSGFRSFT